MNDPVIVWTLAGGAALVAVLLGFAWRASLGKLNEATEALEKSRAGGQKLEKKLDAQRKASESKVEALEALRKKLGKSKKRTAAVREEKSSESTRQQEMAETLEAAEAKIKRLQDEVERLQEAGAGKKPRARTSAPEAADAPEALPEALKEKREAPREEKPRPPRTASEELLERLESKANKAESQALDYKRKVDDAENELKRVRGRAETNHRVYLITKGELEVVNDKLHTLERQLGTNSFRDLLREAGVRVGNRVTAHVPLDPEAKMGESAEDSLAADAEAAVKATEKGSSEEAAS